MRFDNERIYRPSIRVEPVDPSHKLDPASRLNYAKLYTVEHNVKVFFIGQVARRSEQQIVTAYNDVHRPLPDRKYESDGRESDEMFKFSQGPDPVYPAQTPSAPVPSWGQNTSRPGPQYTSTYPAASMTATSMNRSESYSRGFQPEPSLAPAMDRTGSYAGSYMDPAANRARGAYDVSHTGTYQPESLRQSNTERGRDQYGRSSYPQEVVSSSYESRPEYPSSIEAVRGSYPNSYQQDLRYESSTAQRPSYTEPSRSYREDAPSARSPSYVAPADSFAIGNAMDAPPVASSTVARGSSYPSRDFQGSSTSGAPSSYSSAAPAYASPRQRKADEYYEDNKYADPGSRRSTTGGNDYGDDYKTTDSKGRRKEYHRR